MSNSQRVFPITIDPTTTVYPNNEDFWTVQVNSAGNGQSGLPASGQASTGTWYRGFITFNTSSIPAADITNAEINLTTLNKVGNFDSTYAIGITQSNYDLPIWSETFTDLYNNITNPANTAGDYVAITNPANINTSATYNLGTVARTDIAVKTGGANSFFSVSLRQGWDGGNPEDRYVVFGGHDSGSAAPKLILTYTPNDNYCHPSHIYANCAALGDCEYIGIAKVELNEINATTTYNNIPLGYNRYTSTAEVYTNETYSLKVTYKDNGQPVNTGLVAAWIDWNNDGSFDSSEYLGLSNPLNNNQTHTFTFTVPSNAGLTTTRLRVRSVYNDESLSSNMACDSKEYGETEDYLVSVQKSVMDTNELIANNIKVFPNPTRDLLNIDSKVNVVNLELYSLTGQKLLSFTGNQINLNGLPAGNYILKIKTADLKEYNHKVIKK